MIDLKEYWPLNGKRIKVTCTDGQVITGEWIDWTSELDNEPDPESITVEKPWGEQIEIYICEIASIEKAEP